MEESKNDITSLFRAHSSNIRNFSLLPLGQPQNEYDYTSIQALVLLSHIIQQILFYVQNSQHSSQRNSRNQHP